MSIPRLAAPDALADPRALEPVLGSITEIVSDRLETPGFSGSSHHRLTVRLGDGTTRRLVLKRTVIAADWVVVRSGDQVGREAQLLAEPGLSGVWEAFACPYLAWASRDGELGLLMEDLTPHLLPDVREPLADDEEERILAALAALHANFWEAPVLALPWLAQPRQLLSLIGPGTVALQPMGALEHPVHTRARQGWMLAFERLPASVTALLREPPEVLAQRAAHLPRTVTHGDVKVANFALLGDGRVAAFDWALVGAGHVAHELGWYLAVNATRIAVSKERAIARYRVMLEARLGRPLGDSFWADTERNAVLAGGAFLMWSKARALDTGGASARAEWDWWVDRLAAL